jgi:hypothetical protein
LALNRSSQSLLASSKAASKASKASSKAASKAAVIPVEIILAVIVGAQSLLLLWTKKNVSGKKM